MATYSFTASTIQSVRNKISFTNTLFKTDGSKVFISTGVTFEVGRNVASTVVTLSSVNYNDIKSYDTSFSAITNTLNKDYTYNKYADIKYPDKPDKTLTNFIFRNCCTDDSPSAIYVQVPYDEILSGGWVALGYGILFRNKCFIPYREGGDGGYGPVYGFDFKQCKDPVCPKCPPPTPSTTPSVTPSSTPRPGETLTPTPTITHSPTVTPTPSITPPVTPTTSVTPSPSECDGIDCVIEVTPDPSVTPTQTVQTNLSCDVIVTPNVTPTPTQTIIVDLDCDIVVTPNPSSTPTQTIITDLDCEITVN